MRNTAYVQLVNFPDTIYKKKKTKKNKKKKQKNKNITGDFLRIFVPSQILAPFPISEKKLDNYYLLELLNSRSNKQEQF